MLKIKNIKEYYDYIVIGAGSGGLTVAVGLKALKKDVLLVSKNIGGDCTHYGCVPSKALIHFAKEFTTTKDKNIKNKIFQLIKSKIEEINNEEKNLLIHKDINHVSGTAKFISHNQIEVKTEKGKKKISFKKAIIATGSKPRNINLNIPNEKILTNETIFSLQKIPKSLLIIGAGPIGTEMAFAFAKLGTKVYIVSNTTLLPRENKAFTDILKTKLNKLGVEIFENTNIDNINIKEAEYYLIAIGRSPNTNLCLEKAGIEYGEKGIITNNDFITTNKNIFAIGDCIEKPNFTHLANNQGRFVVKKIFLPWISKKETPLPWITYTEPPISTVGITKEDDFVKEYKIDFSKSDRSIIENKKNQIALIYVNMISGKIVGATILGDFGEEIINFFTLAIKKKLSIFELDNFIVPFPTYFSTLNILYSNFIIDYKSNIKSNIIKLFKKNFNRIILAIIWGFLATISFLYLNSINFNTVKLMQELNQLLTNEAGIIIFILLYTLRGLISFPATILTLIGSSIYGFWGGLALIIVASNISSTFAYIMGKTVFSSKTANNSATIIEYLKTNPFEAILVARLTFVPYDLVSYLSGALRLSYKKFILATIIGSLPGTLAFVSFGASVEDTSKTSEFNMEPKFLALGVIVFILSLLISKLLKDKKPKINKSTI